MISTRTMTPNSARRAYILPPGATKTTILRRVVHDGRLRRQWFGRRRGTGRDHGCAGGHQVAFVFAIRAREAYLAIGTFLIGPVRTPVTIIVAVANGIGPIEAAVVGTRGIISV